MTQKIALIAALIAIITCGVSFRGASAGWDLSVGDGEGRG